jgi:glycosyltransferase involved in cell wall biosynthesis
MRIVALLGTFNEQRFVGDCIEHLHEQGVTTYLIDNQSTDDTVRIAEQYVGRGLIGIETLPRTGGWFLPWQLARKQELANSLDADWLIHLDADERRCSANPRQSLTNALHAADEAGFNAVNFLDFMFVPTVESPDHDHPEYERTMRFYFHYMPVFPNRLNAWKRQDGPVDLISSLGHRVTFAGLRSSPRNLAMRHYIFLSVNQLCEKYERSDFRPSDGNISAWRSDLTRVRLPSRRQLRTYTPGARLDRSDPVGHYLFDTAAKIPY